MPEDDLKLEKEVQRLSIDFEKATPLAEWDYREVVFPTKGMLVTIRHKIRGKGRIVFLGVHWRFAAPPEGSPADTLPPTMTQSPQLYTHLGEEHQFEGYIKIRSTVAGYATVLVGLRRDG